MGNCQDKRSVHVKTFIDPKSLKHTEIDQLQNGKPILIQQGLRIKRNNSTKKLQGVPEQWAKKYKVALQIDMQKVVKTSHLPKQIRPASELPKSIIEFIQKRQQQKQMRQKVSFSGIKISSKIKQNLKIGSKIKDSSDKKKLINLEDMTQQQNLFANQILDQIQLSQISELSDPDQQQLFQLIQLQDQPIYQSQKQALLLTTQQFQKYLAKVKIIYQNPAEKFDFYEQIGKGSMCKVFKVSSKLNNNIIYAVKIMNLDQTRTIQKIKEEIAAMEMCFSENIIDYFFTYVYRQTLFMFMEYMQYGSLTNFIKFYKQRIPQNTIAFITYQILKGLNCIHNRWQIHRDLKSDNILINKEGQIKISDFGYALQFTKEKLCSRDVVGTPAWMAPELISKKQYTESVDIWSLGIIIMELCVGQPKYLRIKPLRAMYLIVSQQPPKVQNQSQNLTRFVEKCLKKDPQKRATIKQLLEEPFIKNINFRQQKTIFKKMMQESIS